MCEYPGGPLIDSSEETIDDLTRNDMKVIQSRRGYRFSMDAVLLAHFAEIRPADKVLDLGCGSGVISLLLAADEPSAQITGLELQPALAGRARRSIAMNGLSSQVKIVEGDLRALEDLPDGSGYDLVVANPPFWRVGEGVLSPNPERQMARHEVSATLMDFIRCGARALRLGGRLAIINRSDRLLEVRSLMQQHGLEPKRGRFIHPRHDRDANLVLVEGIKGAAAGMTMMSPLVVYEAENIYSREIREIYSAPSDTQHED